MAGISTTEVVVVEGRFVAVLVRPAVVVLVAEVADWVVVAPADETEVTSSVVDEPASPEPPHAETSSTTGNRNPPFHNMRPKLQIPRCSCAAPDKLGVTAVALRTDHPVLEPFVRTPRVRDIGAYRAL